MTVVPLLLSRTLLSRDNHPALPQRWGFDFRHPTWVSTRLSPIHTPYYNHFCNPFEDKES
jgi:hypothetical protein